MANAHDKRIRAATDLLSALRNSNPIVIAAAAAEVAFRFQSGMLGVEAAQGLFEQLRVLGWPGELSPAEIERVGAKAVRRFRIVMQCRMCGETFRVEPALHDDQIRKKARDLSPPKVTLHQDLLLPGDTTCLGLVTVLGLHEV